MKLQSLEELYNKVINEIRGEKGVITLNTDLKLKIYI